MVAIIKLKRYVASIYNFSVVINNFSNSEEFNPIILFVIDENSKVSFYYTILPLSLAINLKIKSGKKSLLDFKKRA